MSSGGTLDVVEHLECGTRRSLVCGRFFGGSTCASRRHYTTEERVAPRGAGVPHHLVRDPKPRRLGGVRAGGRGGSGRLVAGRLRRPRPEVLPQGRHRQPGASRCRKTTCPSGCGGASRTRRQPTAVQYGRQVPPAASARPGRCFTASPALGPIGAGRPAYFDAESDARAFYDELVAMLALQIAAPNSPQWFNTGLHWAYGIDGPAQGHYYVDPPDSAALKRGRIGLRTSRSRTPASSRALPGRPRQRGRDHGPLGARGAPLQVRLWHRHQLLQPAR